MDMNERDADIHTLYYKCSKCGKSNSQLYCPGFSQPYHDCPFCGGKIVFEPSCWTCSEQLTPYCGDCHDFSAYRQKVKS